VTAAYLNARSVAPPVDKRFATLQARAALAGAMLSRIETDDGSMAYVLTRWALTKQLPDLDAVEAWLARLQGPAK